MKGLANLGLVLLIVASIGGVIYGCYWVAKTVSYTIFYEGMVQSTVRDMVKQEALK